MKIFKNIFAVLLTVVLAFGCAGCTEKQGGTQEQPDQEPARASDLLTLFYHTIEKQNGVNPREKVYIVAHRANTLKAIQEFVPENSLECIQMAIESGVVDMIEMDFMRFPVFNVADCFITCGCVLLTAHLVFCNKEFWKEDKK